MNIIQARTQNRPLTGPDTLLNAFWLDTVHYRPPDTSKWINCDVVDICDTLGLDCEVGKVKAGVQEVTIR